MKRKTKLKQAAVNNNHGISEWKMKLNIQSEASILII